MTGRAEAVRAFLRNLPRCCYTHKGRPKVRRTRADALAARAGNQQAYPCPVCGHWHVGTPHSAKRRAATIEA